MNLLANNINLLLKTPAINPPRFFKLPKNVEAALPEAIRDFLFLSNSPSTTVNTATNNPLPLVNSSKALKVVL